METISPVEGHLVLKVTCTPYSTVASWCSAHLTLTLRRTPSHPCIKLSHPSLHAKPHIFIMYTQSFYNIPYNHHLNCLSFYSLTTGFHPKPEAQQHRRRAQLCQKPPNGCWRWGGDVGVLLSKTTTTYPKYVPRNHKIFGCHARKQGSANVAYDLWQKSHTSGLRHVIGVDWRFMCPELGQSS